jgi:tetratricopeptide (TPR) repeat protein
MTSAAETRSDAPGPLEVRAEVERMAVSDVFRTSPQLVLFLRFVVEAVLTGNSQRIKGYTIAVEVLRRDAKFDPRIDPIVRVEAGRLRRTIDRYYRGPGADDPVIIDLPRGGYVPIFRWRDAAARGPIEPDGLRARLGWVPRHWLAAAAIVLAATIAAGILVSSRLNEGPADGAAIAPASDRGIAPRADQRAPGNGLPVMAIEAFDVAGVPGPGSILAGPLRERISAAFSRFDLVNIVEDSGAAARAHLPPPAGAARSADCRFGGSLEYDADGRARVAFRLVNAADNNVIWSQVFDHVAAGEDRAAAEDAIVRQLAQTLLQPFGVIYAHGRSRSLADGVGDPRYRCILDAAESFRSFDAEQHLSARACLERLTEADSSFAIGFSYLASIYLREYQYGIGATGDGRPALDRALRAARRGVELNPASARAYEMLFVVLFARGDLPSAFAAGDRAIALNRYDARTLNTYAARLIASGDVDKGTDMLARAADDGIVLPGMEQFFLFLGYYLRGDLTRAAFHAGQLTSDSFQLGLLARILMAGANGDRDGARRAADRLVALNPAWRDDLRGTLAKFFAADAIIDRLVRDLGEAGIGRS